MSNRNYPNAGRNFMWHMKPVTLDCNFIVDSTNGNGLGIRSLKGGGINNVFMNTSASFTGTTHTGTAVIDGISGGTASLVVGMPIQTTDLPAGATIASITSGSAITSSVAATTGHAGATITYQGLGLDGRPNPNPAAGYIMVKLTDTYNRYLYGTAGFVSPVSGTPLTSTTAGLVYVIVSLGTTTLAQWYAAGLPSSLTPAVGMPFVALATGAIGGTGAVEVPKTGASGIDHIEIVGDPNSELVAVNPVGGIVSGGYVLQQCLFEGALTAPNDGTVIGLTMCMSDSSILIAGE